MFYPEMKFGTYFKLQIRIRIKSSDLVYIGLAIGGYSSNLPHPWYLSVFEFKEDPNNSGLPIAEFSSKVGRLGAGD